MMEQVHPRSRGEYTIDYAGIAASLGSSPLTRGIHRRTHKAIKKVWFIPAHAGNTRLSGKWAHRAEVHPRSRGEYTVFVVGCASFGGSSPLTRGIQVIDALDSDIGRFIPAHAGNTVVGI